MLTNGRRGGVGLATIGRVSSTDARISPSPSPDEAVAIVAAVEALWPQPMVVGQTERDDTTAWRFSGRWWHRDRFAHAERPWS